MLVRSCKWRPPINDGSFGICSELPSSSSHSIILHISFLDLTALSAESTEVTVAPSSFISFLLTLPCRPSAFSQSVGLKEFRIDGSDPNVSLKDAKSKEITQKLETVDETFMAVDDFKCCVAVSQRRDMVREMEEARPYETTTVGSSRPSSATRPGTAPALFTLARSSHYVGPEVISRSSTSGSGTSAAALPNLNGLGTTTASDIELLEESPFAFNVPGVADVQATDYNRLSPSIDIPKAGREFPHATVWDVCGSWP